MTWGEQSFTPARIHGQLGGPCTCGDDAERHALLHGLDCLRVGRPDLLWAGDREAVLKAMEPIEAVDPCDTVF